MKRCTVCNQESPYFLRVVKDSQDTPLDGLHNGVNDVCPECFKVIFDRFKTWRAMRERMWGMKG